MKKSLLVLCLVFLIFGSILQASIEQDKVQKPCFDFSDDWRREVPFTIDALSATAWVDITPASNRGATFVCENHDVILCIATSATLATANFANGLFWVWDSGDRRIIPSRQLQSGYHFYAKCDSGDISSKVLDAAVAVDKGTDPETVGIPSAAHGFAVGDYVILDGTTSYDGTHLIVSQTAGEFVIYAIFVAETFAGTDTAIQTPVVISALGGS